MRKLLLSAVGILLVPGLAGVGVFAHLENSQACLVGIIQRATFDRCRERSLASVRLDDNDLVGSRGDAGQVEHALELRIGFERYG